MTKLSCRAKPAGEAGYSALPKRTSASKRKLGSGLGLGLGLGYGLDERLLEEVGAERPHRGEEDVPGLG